MFCFLYIRKLPRVLCHSYKITGGMSVLLKFILLGTWWPYQSQLGEIFSIVSLVTNLFPFSFFSLPRIALDFLNWSYISLSSLLGIGSMETSYCLLAVIFSIFHFFFYPSGSLSWLVFLIHKYDVNKKKFTSDISTFSLNSSHFSCHS